MAKVNIVATAHICEGSCLSEDTRNALLFTLGKNDKLLEDVKANFESGVDNTFTRPTDAGGYVQLQNTDYGAVVVRHLDSDGKLIGSVIYGKTKFFSCLDEE